MKKLYLLFTFLLISTLSFGQTTLANQDFEGSGTWSYTESPATYNVSGDVWAVVGSLSTITPQSGSKFWGMQDLDNTNGGGAFDHTLSFPNVSVTGQSDILVTFYYYTIGFDSTDNIRVEFFFDDVSQGEEVLSKDTGGAWALVSKVVPNGTSNVRFTILAFQNGASDYAGVDNVLLQSGAVTDPSLTITSPLDGDTVNSGHTGFDASLDVQNFTVSGDAGGGVSDNSGDGFIKYSVDSGTSVNKFDTGAINITGLSSGPHTLYAELVDNSGNPLSSAVNETVNFTVNNIIIPLPAHEPFDYTTGETLDAQTIWTNNFSGDDVLIDADNLSYSTLVGTGASAGFDGSGADPTIDFTPVSSGKIYASFMLKVTDISTTATDGYFAILRDSDGDYESRVWISPIGPDFTTYSIGISNSGTLTQINSTVHNINDVVFVVFNYDLDNNTVSAWINPTLGTAEPAADITEASSSTGNTMQQFMIRQDSTNKTPTIIMDELRGGTTWEDVTTASTASTSENLIDGFSVYPNPVENTLYIKTKANAEKQVQIFDLLGKKVVDQTVVGQSMNLNLRTGLYVIKVEENGKTASQKLMVK